MEDSDVVVVGGGPAGLQAALTLARVHVRTVLVDSGAYRNAAADRMHNVLGWDGATPEELRSAGRAELERYDVPIRRESIDRIRAIDGGFELDGADAIRTRSVVLATGVRDELAPIPGLAELWGDLAVPCPYCHGHEFAGRRIILLGTGWHAEHVGGLLRRIAGELVVVDPVDAVRLDRLGDGVELALRNGSTIEAAVVFVASGPVQRAPFAQQLGLELVDGVGIRIDPLGRTSRSGVWAAGDAAQRQDRATPASVVAAMASGLVAGADCAAALATGG